MKYALIILLFSSQALASFELGVGTTSATAGRVVPSVAGALTFSNTAITAFATGVQSEIYYHSAYGFSYYKIWKAGDFWGGEMQAGFGVGLLYAERGFEDTGGASPESESDYAIGPAIRMNWTPFYPFYINIEGTYGLRDLFNHLTLNFQDTLSLSVGVRIL